MLSPKQTMHLMWDGSALQRNVNEVLLGLFDSLGNRDRDFSGFPLADPDPPMAITDNNERAEVETLPAFHDLCDAIDKYDFVFQA
jgi:hypothetical protein